MTTRERLELIASCSALFEEWTGPFDASDLIALIHSEFGSASALDEPIPHDGRLVRIKIPPKILHVVSGNTPHAAFQSVLRGLVLGSVNCVKLPSSGLPAFERAVSKLPSTLAGLVELLSELPPSWQTEFETVVVFGSDDTIATFSDLAPDSLNLVPHGHRLSIALIDGGFEDAGALAAKDVSLFDQRGCLSVHDIYVAPNDWLSPREFARHLTFLMEDFNRETPRSPLDPSAAGAITTLRETVRFISASRPDDVSLWESAGSTDWTVIYDSDPALRISPLNRVVYVKPWPEGDARDQLGPNLRHLSTIALHPYDDARAASLADLGAHRICPLGETQNPPLTWHQDGLAPLASLVTRFDPA